MARRPRSERRKTTAAQRREYREAMIARAVALRNPVGNPTTIKEAKALRKKQKATAAIEEFRKENPGMLAPNVKLRKGKVYKFQKRQKVA